LAASSFLSRVATALEPFQSPLLLLPCSSLRKRSTR
jgi:hypothetical protein